jgi:hypothetical protein
MSIRRPLPSHEPAAMSWDSKTVMSWQEFVSGTGCQVAPLVAGFVLASQAGVALAHGCCGVDGAFCRPLTAPVVSLRNRRGSLTIAAWVGFASGTLMTSIRHCDGFEVSGPPGLQVAISSVWPIVPDVPET